MSYQILFTDLDGTFLNSRSEITDANKKAVALAQEAGKQVVLCSGRSWRSLTYFEQELGLNKPGCYGISFNGGIVYANPSHERKFLLKQPLENKFGLEMVSVLKKMSDDLLIYAGDELYAEKETPMMVHYSSAVRIPAQMVHNFSEIPSDFVKILVKGSNTLLREIEKEMKNQFDASLCNIFFSAAELLEIGPVNGHKGYGVKFLTEFLNIPMESVITMGDEANDITMLECAGMGIAVANAVPSVKNAADVVLEYSNDQNAFSYIVSHYLV